MMASALTTYDLCSILVSPGIDEDGQKHFKSAMAIINNHRMTTSDSLLAAADFLERKGWYKGSLRAIRNETNGSELEYFGVVQAISVICDDKLEASEVETALLIYLLDTKDPLIVNNFRFHTLEAWEEHQQSYQPVLDALRSCANDLNAAAPGAKSKKMAELRGACHRATLKSLQSDEQMAIFELEQAAEMYANPKAGRHAASDELMSKARKFSQVRDALKSHLKEMGR